MACKVFNSHAPSNHSNNSKAVYRRHEMSKKRSYEARIHEVDHGTFTPSIFSATGGMADEATTFYKLFFLTSGIHLMLLYWGG